jgi:hypothetical protein
MKVGFSPRKRSLTVYLTPGLDDIEDLREVLGKHRVGKGARAQVVEGHPYHELSRRKDFIDTGSRPSILFDYLSYHKKNEVSFLKNTVPSQVYFNYADTL